MNKTIHLLKIIKAYVVFDRIFGILSNIRIQVELSPTELICLSITGEKNVQELMARLQFATIEELTGCYALVDVDGLSINLVSIHDALESSIIQKSALPVKPENTFYSLMDRLTQL